MEWHAGCTAVTAGLFSCLSPALGTTGWASGPWRWGEFWNVNWGLTCLRYKPLLPVCTYLRSQWSSEVKRRLQSRSYSTINQPWTLWNSSSFSPLAFSIQHKIHFLNPNIPLHLYKTIIISVGPHTHLGCHPKSSCTQICSEMRRWWWVLRSWKMFALRRLQCHQGFCKPLTECQDGCSFIGNGNQHNTVTGITWRGGVSSHRRAWA